MFEYSEAKTLEELFYPMYDLSNFSWDSINHTLNHTALTAEFTGIPATDPSGSFSNGSLAFRVSPQGQRGGVYCTGMLQGEHSEYHVQSTFSWVSQLVIVLFF